MLYLIIYIILKIFKSSLYILLIKIELKFLKQYFIINK